MQQVDQEVCEEKEQFCLGDGTSLTVPAVKDEVKLKEAEDGTIKRTCAPSFFENVEYQSQKFKVSIQWQKRTL